MSTTDQLEQFLKMSTQVARQCTRPKDFRFSGYDEAYFRLGKAFSQDDFTPDEQREIVVRIKHHQRINKRRFKPQQKQCFSNAWFWAGQGVFDYADGKATSLIPVDHAWNVFNGKVLDFTWRAEGDTAKWSAEKLLERARRNNQDKVYWGITVPLKELYRHRIAVGHRLYVDEPPDFPVLKTGTLPWELEGAFHE